MRYTHISSTVILLTFLSACIPLQPNQNLTTELSGVKSRVAKLETQTQQVEHSTEKIRELFKRQAELQAQMNNIRIDIQTINGRLADQEYSVQQLREELNIQQSDLISQMSGVKERLQQLNYIQKPQDPVSVKPLKVEQGAEQTAPAAQVPDNSADEKTTATAQEATTEAEQLYRNALRLVQQDMDFSASRKLFEQFIQQYPQHELAVNAMYWIGETMYGDKKYEHAILQFQDVIQMYPQHPKIPAALLKQGLAFYQLGDTRNAKIILQKVVEKYPDSKEAQKAQLRLEKW